MHSHESLHKSFDETIQIKGRNYTISLVFTRYGEEQDPYCVYELEIFIDEQPFYLHETYGIEWGSVPVLQVLRKALTALDDWGKRHPQSFLTTFNCDLYRLSRTLRRQGFACDGRMDTWVTYINHEGQRVLYKGMLNLIEDKLAINDLWRVAKDTDYYLGYIDTPVDAFKRMLKRLEGGGAAFS
jgi:hypothetical protein